MKYLLDSNVISEPTKKQPEKSVLAWLREHERDCAISVLVLGEVERGILQLPEGSKRKQGLQMWFNNYTNDMEKRGRILPVDRRLMNEWARVHLREELATRREPPAIDTLLAATAELHGLTMVTRNEKDFPKSLPVINPWKL